MAIRARVSLAYLTTDETGATHARFAPTAGDHVEHKDFSPGIPNNELSLSFAPGLPVPPELVVDGVYLVDLTPAP